MIIGWTSTYRIEVKKGDSSASARPSPGGNGRTPSFIMVEATYTPYTLWFAFEGTKMTTDAMPLSGGVQFSLANPPGEPVNDYTLTANLNEPATAPVSIIGQVNYAS